MKICIYRKKMNIIYSSFDSSYLAERNFAMIVVISPVACIEQFPEVKLKFYAFKIILKSQTNLEHLVHRIFY